MRPLATVMLVYFSINMKSLICNSSQQSVGSPSNPHDGKVAVRRRERDKSVSTDKK